MSVSNENIDWNEMAALLSPLKIAKARIPLEPDVVARIEFNKQTAKNRQMAKQLGYPNLYAPGHLSIVHPLPSSISEEDQKVMKNRLIPQDIQVRIAKNKRAAEERLKNAEVKKAEMARQQGIAIKVIEYHETQAEKRRRERSENNMAIRDQSLNIPLSSDTDEDVQFDKVEFHFGVLERGLGIKPPKCIKQEPL